MKRIPRIERATLIRDYVIDELSRRGEPMNISARDEAGTATQHTANRMRMGDFSLMVWAPTDSTIATLDIWHRGCKVATWGGFRARPIVIVK